MELKTNEQLLADLRAIGWTDSDIAASYPDLLPYYLTGPPTTLFERLLSIGWTEEEIRAQHIDILPESEGGVLETVGEPVDKGIDEMIAGPSEDFPLGGLRPQEVPSIGGNQTADLLTLALLFL